MGEIDTKPIESVQVALSLFGQKSDQRRYGSAGTKVTKEKELDLMQKDLANYKVQLDAKESANMQALLQLEFYHNAVKELSAQLEKSEAERDRYIEEHNVARAHVDKLELENKKILTQLLDTGKAVEQLQFTLDELNGTQGELDNLKRELAVAEKSKFSILTRAEEMEAAANMEREKTEELLEHLSELNEAIHLSKLAAIEAEKEKSTFLSEKEAEIQMSATAALEAQKQLEHMRGQLDVMKDTKEQLSSKSLVIDSLQKELEQTRDSHSSSLKAASDAIDDLNRLKLEIERLEKLDSERKTCIELIGTELKQSKEQMQNAREEVNSLSLRIKLISGEVQNLKNKMAETERREAEAQIEIATIKSELHKSRSKMAAAEAAEARAKSATSGLYLAVQQLALEAEEAKKESLRLKEPKKAKAYAVAENNAFGSPLKIWKGGELSDDAGEKVTGAYSQGFCSGITISTEEYESLIQKAEKADKIADSPTGDAFPQVDYGREWEMESLKKELEAANAEINRLKSITEQSSKRADLAEKAKEAVEDQLRKWREEKQRRRTALTALHEELSYKDGSYIDGPIYDKPSGYEPLGKVLNIKF